MKKSVIHIIACTGVILFLNTCKNRNSNDNVIIQFAGFVKNKDENVTNNPSLIANTFGKILIQNNTGLSIYIDTIENLFLPKKMKFIKKNDTVWYNEISDIFFRSGEKEILPNKSYSFYFPVADDLNNVDSIRLQFEVYKDSITNLQFNLKYGRDNFNKFIRK